MKSKRSKFRVRIYEGEFIQLCQWTLKKTRIETGGDLFGLWHDDNTPVVQLVLGPGKKVRRSGVSFYQDLEYLDEVGSALTEDGLCHIGEWHSHHQLGLAKPSYGDEETVWQNMPRYGLTKFFICISNITADYQGQTTASVGCFLFETDPESNKQLPVLKGEFEILPENSPCRIMLQQFLCKGAESFNKTMDTDKRREFLERRYVKRGRKDSLPEHSGDDNSDNYTWLWRLWLKFTYIVNIVCPVWKTTYTQNEESGDEYDEDDAEGDISLDEFSDGDDGDSNQARFSLLSRFWYKLTGLWEIFSRRIRAIWDQAVDYAVTG